MDHIVANQAQWTRFYNYRDKALTFEDLPNKDQIDITYFAYIDAEE